MRRRGALAEDWEKALSYGTGIGHPGLCEWVAERHGGLDAGQVMVANGSLEAGWMLFEHLLEPGDRVVVEQPTYDRTLLMLQRLGVELVPVPLEADGLDLGAFEAALAEGPIKLAHIIPNFHNPAGCTLSRREAGAAGRARRRARLLDLRGRPLPRAALRGRGAGDDALDRQGRPGRPRLLLLEDGQPRRPRRLPGRAGGARSPSSPSGPTRPTSRRTCWPSRSCSSSAARAASTATSSSSRAPCATRRDALVEALREQIPEAEFVVPGGGYFLWLDLAEGTDTPALLAEAKGEGVAFVAGPDFMIEGGENSLRLSFASVPPERIPEGVARIARALERVRAGSPA